MKIKSQQLNIDPLLLPVEREVNKCSQDVTNDKHVCRLPEVKTGHLIDIFLSPSLSICHCCLSFSVQKGNTSGVNSNFICGFSRFQENRFSRKTGLGINYFNKTKCEEFLTHK
jgi:hypothetical protein